MGESKTQNHCILVGGEDKEVILATPFQAFLPGL